MTMENTTGQTQNLDTKTLLLSIDFKVCEEKKNNKLTKRPISQLVDRLGCAIGKKIAK